MPPKQDASKPMSKAQLMTELATMNDMTKKAVEEFYDSISVVIRRELRSKGEIAILPGLVVLKKATRKASKARMGRNPATGEAMQISAKPAKTVVRASLRKALKEMV
jgi:nucleoid DNA-binding protein